MGSALGIRASLEIGDGDEQGGQETPSPRTRGTRNRTGSRESSLTQDSLAGNSLLRLPTALNFIVESTVEGRLLQQILNEIVEGLTLPLNGFEQATRSLGYRDCRRVGKCGRHTVQLTSIDLRLYPSIGSHSTIAGTGDGCNSTVVLRLAPAAALCSRVRYLPGHETIDASYAAVSVGPHVPSEEGVKSEH